ncbi:hypothetical protein BJ912DRAFT_937116 [Pholiota molesta]|nr:hypothetical protein BJ912DRAFT_937116 [Pholiota molesta]
MPSTRSKSRNRNTFGALGSLIDSDNDPIPGPGLVPPAAVSTTSPLDLRDQPPHLGNIHSPDSSHRLHGRRSSTRSISPDSDRLSTLQQILAGQNAHMADIMNLNRTMLESVCEWMSGMVATQAAARPAHNPSALKIRMANPDQFDGSPRMMESFINSCVNIFMAQPSLYNNVESRVRFALSFMKGDTLRWRDARFKDIKEGTYTFTTWEAFEEQLRDSFGNPHNFFIEFEDLKAEAGFNDAAMVFELKRALRKDVRDETNRQIPKAALGTAIGRKWYSGLTRLYRQPSSATSTANAPPAMSSASMSVSIPNRPRQPGAMPSLTTRSFPTSFSGLSASSSMSSGKQSTRNQGCYGCGDLDHQWRNCKKTKFGDKARVLLERVDEVDAVVESLRKVMEDTSLDEEADCDTKIFARIANEFPVFFVESDE